MLGKCSKCGEKPAVVLIKEVKGQNAHHKGLCGDCAKSMGINVPKNLFGITDENLQEMFSEEQLEKMNEQAMKFMNGEPMENMDMDVMNTLMEKMSENMNDSENPDVGFSPFGAALPPLDFFQDGTAEEQSEDDGKRKKSGKAKDKKDEKTREKGRKFLNLYCTDLNEKAKNGKIDKIIGRDKELQRVVQILSRRMKNNPCLIGEPGVGKTAIAEGLALKITKGEVPAKLAQSEIHLLDLTALVAGTQFRGQFESRIKSLIKEVISLGNIILFIDEVHNLVGGGDADGTMNAANILKPALSRGEIQVIGATTFKEYRKHIEKDSALERRFQPVVVEEPSVDETIEILKGIRDYYEEFHSVKISDEIIKRAVYLSERYINDRFLPDKAIDLLDEASAAKRLKNTKADELYKLTVEIKALEEGEQVLQEDESGEIDYEALATLRARLAKSRKKLSEIKITDAAKRITDEDLAKVIELWTGVQAAKIEKDDLLKLVDLEKTLNSKIIGQTTATAAIANGIKRSRVQISPRPKPASFIFVGPTGVGKTELVKVLNAELFTTPDSLVRLDMSEFMEKHSVSRIIGAPPGYIGFDEAGQLTEKIRRKPYCILLLDEIEKAHPDVLNILLQILDDGHVTDTHGRNVSFKNVIIIMTCNAANDKISNSLGFNKTSETLNEEKTKKALEEFLRPEFIGRIDEIITFNPLSEEDFIGICKLMLEELKTALLDKTITFTWEEKVCEYIADKAYGNRRGARDLRIIIRKEIEDKIANLLIEKSAKQVKQISLSVKNNEISLDN